MPRRAVRHPGEIVHRLRQCPLSKLESSMLERLARSAQPLTFEHGERVWRRGDADTMACAIEGALDIIRHDAVVDTLGPGQMLGLSVLWGRPHSADVRARKTDKDFPPELLCWDASDEDVLRLFRSPPMLSLLLEEASGLIHHLNELQVLYRRKSGAAAHIAIHLRRLGEFRGSREVEIGQRDLGMLTGYEPRTVRIALGELAAEGCVTSPRRSIYRLDSVRLDDFIERQKADPQRAEGSAALRAEDQRA